MRIVERNVYVGPSLYAHFPVIKLVLDLGALEDWPTGRLGATYVDALLAALPGLQEHCSYGVAGGFIRRIRGDSDAAEQQQGVAHSAITLLPDEQEAIDAALRMGQPGDLLLVFADALTRSWKQVIKFKPEAATGNPARAAALSSPLSVPAAATPRADSADASLEAAAPNDAEPLSSGFVRDERGLRFVGEAAD